MKRASRSRRTEKLRTRSERTYTVVIHPADPDEGGFWAEVPAMPGCNTQGESYEETIANARDAIEGYLRMLVKFGAYSSSTFPKDQRIDLRQVSSSAPSSPRF